MAVVITFVQWVVLALAAIWAICTNIALRQHYKHSDQPTLPANATALTQLTGVVAVAVAGWSSCSAGSGSTLCRQSRHQTISRTCAAAELPSVAGGPV